MPLQHDVSPGQLRVRAIGATILKNWGIDVLQEFESPAYEEFIDQLARDEVVTGDEYTGRKISDCNLSRSYQQWLRSTPCKKVAPVSLDQLRFDRMMIAGRATAGDPHQHVYQGGSGSYDTTARAALTFIAGRPMHSPPSDTVRAAYYVQSRTFVVGSNGNHRCLANKLVGSKAFPLDSIKFYQEPFFSEALDSTLMAVEKFLPLACTIALSDKPHFTKQLLTLRNLWQENETFVHLMHHYLNWSEQRTIKIALLNDFWYAYQIVFSYRNRGPLYRYFRNLEDTPVYKASAEAVKRLAWWIKQETTEDFQFAEARYY